jgi:hypothetical protein
MSATETAPVALPDDYDGDGNGVSPNQSDSAPEPEAPVPAPPPPGAATPAARARTSRVVMRRVDPWSVLKLSLLFYLCMCLVLLVAGSLLWAAASAAGVIGNIESFVADIGFDDFRFIPGDILRASTIGGLVLVVAGTLANTLLAVLFNLMADIVGGLKVTLAEDVPRSRGRR